MNIVYGVTEQSLLLFVFLLSDCISFTSCPTTIVISVVEVLYSLSESNRK